MFSSRQIANYFISRSQVTGEELTPMKLIKLCYIAHGWHLGFFNTPLLNEDICAWKYGPVIESVYDDFKRYGNSPITELLSDGYNSTKYPMPTEDKFTFLDSIWSGYGKFDGIKLSSLTHQSGTPWDRVWNKEGGKTKRNAVIPNSYIDEHYKEKIRLTEAKIERTEVA